MNVTEVRVLGPEAGWGRMWTGSLRKTPGSPEASRLDQSYRVG